MLRRLSRAAREDFLYVVLRDLASFFIGTSANFLSFVKRFVREFTDEPVFLLGGRQRGSNDRADSKANRA